MALCRQAGSQISPKEIVGAVADRAASAAGIEPFWAKGDTAWLSLVDDPPDGWADPWIVQSVHEQAVSVDERRTRGAWYTPRSVVEGLVAETVEPFLQVDICADHPAGISRVTPADFVTVDPTCGGGGFLLAALDCLNANGVAPLDAVSRVRGMDIDVEAVAAARWSVQLWLALHGGCVDARAVALVERNIVVGDALIDDPVGERLPGQSVVIVGNPPFASPLKKGAVAATAAAFRADNVDSLGPYADASAAHLLRAVQMAADGDRVCLVQPLSLVSSRDTERLRAQIDSLAPLQGLWAAREALFDASVRTCAPIMERGGQADCEVWLGYGPEVVSRNCPSGPGPHSHSHSQTRAQSAEQTQTRRIPWASLVADALGAPAPPMMSDRSLGELMTATAGFRDEHYGLIEGCREADPACDAEWSGVGLGPEQGRLVTVGAIDPLWIGWGRAEFRFGGTKRIRPIIDRGELPTKVQRWFDRQRVPKVLLATQTKLLEPVVDHDGDLIPATPLIAIHAEADHLNRIAAVLLAPPVVLWAWRRFVGSALSVDAVKLAARQVGEIPLPIDHAAWDKAADLVGERSAVASRSCPDAHSGAGDGGSDIDQAQAVAVDVARLMNTAYGASDEVFEWWCDRLRPV